MPIVVVDRSVPTLPTARGTELLHKLMDRLRGTMTALLTGIFSQLFGHLPIGWLQLIHNRTRFAAALSGVAFANILIFMQLGFLGALISSIGLPYKMMNADILVMSSDANTLSDGSPLPRQRMFQALATQGVADATAVYYGRID